MEGAWIMKKIIGGRSREEIGAEATPRVAEAAVTTVVRERDRGRSHSTCNGGCGDDSSDDNSHDTPAIGIWRWWEGYGYGD